MKRNFSSHSHDMMSPRTPSHPCPMVAAVTMGYGHLRAAHPLAEALGTEVVRVDEPPLADAREASLWSWVRRMHEVLSKPIRSLGALEGPTRALMDALTSIPPLHEPRAHHEPSWAVHVLDHMIRRGLGTGMVRELKTRSSTLLTTFYAPAIIADRAGIEHVFCVVTDADCNRIWAPLDASKTRIHYLAPSRRVVRRLRSFGVPASNISLTGFPLPPSLTGQAAGTPSLRARLYGRLARLDPGGGFRELHEEDLFLAFQDTECPPAAASEPPTLLFAVGGAGAQTELVSQFLPSLSHMVSDGRLKVQLASGIRTEVRDSFLDSITRAGLSPYLDERIEIVDGASFQEYYENLNRALLRTDILWTKPSELSFYPALGLPCIVAPPVGAHERYNRRWLREQGIGLKQRRPDLASGWLSEWLEDGTLAAAAWAGYTRMPKHGTERIAALARGQELPSRTSTLAPLVRLGA